MRQRHNLGSFLTILENDIIGRWPRDRYPENVNRVIFYTDFNCDLQLYAAAFQLTSNMKTDYNLTHQNLFWRTFNDYSQFCQINETNLWSAAWKQNKRFCREFAKHKICIHVLELAYRYKFICYLM